MNLFTFQVKDYYQEETSVAVEQIKEILRVIKETRTFRFTQDWVQLLLRLFRSKEQMQLFWTIFNGTSAQSQISTKNPLLKGVNNQIKKQQTDTVNNNCIRQRRQVLQKQIAFAPDGQRYKQWMNMENSDDKMTKLTQAMREHYSINHAQYKKKFNVAPQIIQQIKYQYISFKKGYIQKFNISHIAIKYKLHRPTIYRLIKKWDSQAQFKDIMDKLGHHTFTKCRRSTNQQVELWRKSIQTIVENDANVSILDVKSQLEDQWNHTPGMKFIRKILEQLKNRKRGLNRNIQLKNTASNMVVRMKYCQIYLGIVNHPHMEVYFMDEQKFDFINQAYYTNSIKDECQNHKRGKQFASLLAILSPNRSCFYETVINAQGEDNSSNIECSLQKLFNHLKSKNKQVVLIINNISLSSQRLKQLSSNYNLKVLMLPPQSQQLSPCYYFLQQLIKELKKTEICTSIFMLQETINKISLQMKDWQLHFDEIRSKAQKAANDGKL